MLQWQAFGNIECGFSRDSEHQSKHAEHMILDGINGQHSRGLSSGRRNISTLWKQVVTRAISSFCAEIREAITYSWMIILKEVIGESQKDLVVITKIVQMFEHESCTLL